MRTIYFITHPDVIIDPTIPITQWPLSPRGKERMKQLLSKAWVATIGALYCSREQKAIDGADILAKHLGLQYSIRPDLGENDRSTTGVLSFSEFNRAVDLFFAHPQDSFRGWETAKNAQDRIINAIQWILDNEPTEKNIAIIAHGGVGTLLMCHLKNVPIDRKEDQPGTSGGNYFAFTDSFKEILHGWMPIDQSVGF